MIPLKGIEAASLNDSFNIFLYGTAAGSIFPCDIAGQIHDSLGTGRCSAHIWHRAGLRSMEMQEGNGLIWLKGCDDSLGTGSAG